MQRRFFLMISRLFEKVKKNTFLKVSSANGFVTILRSMILILTNKVIASTIGASGIAMIGQFQNFIAISTSISNGGFQQGLTKYIAENSNKKNELKTFIGTSFQITIILTSLIALIILLFSKPLTVLILNDLKYRLILVIFSFALLFYNINNLVMAIINGFQLYKTYFKWNMLTSIVSFILTCILVVFLGNLGALLALVLTQFLVFFFTYFLIKKFYWVAYLSFNSFEKEKMYLLLKYTLITLTTSIIWPVVNLVIRSYIINNISFQEAGIWQAVRNINDYIIMMAVGSFSIYLLPRLASLEDNELIRKELLDIYKLIIPLCLLGFTILYFFRDLIMLILYSKEFIYGTQYLLLQMIGSFFWICKLPIMNYILAKGLTKTFITIELFHAALYILLTIVLMPEFHIKGVQLAFAIYNFIYLIVNIFIIKKLIYNDSKTIPN